MNAVNDIIDGIAKAIYNEFGEGYTIYKEQVPQNAETPCFFILCTYNSLNRFRGKRYKVRNHYVIQYIPPDDADIRTECYDVSQRLSLCLEFVGSGDGLIKGNNMSSTTTEDLLEFTVDFDLFAVRDETPETPMKNVIITQTVGDPTGQTTP